MLPIHQPKCIRRSQVCVMLAPLAVLAASSFAPAQQQDRFTEPVYRVAHEQPAQQPQSATPSGPAAGATQQTPFNITEQPGEHPLAPVVRIAKESLDHIEQNVSDYSATLVKRERLNGQLGEPQHIFLNVRHQPFSVYMQFLRPHEGREVIYVDGQHDNQLLVLEGGWRRRVLGKMQLDPTGMVAMRGQKYPITKVGMHNLLQELIEQAENDMQFGESEVTIDGNQKVDRRPATLIQVVHPVPRQNFRTHIVRVFFDNELRVPIHYDAFLWPQQPGGQPVLDESYTYTNLKLNNGFTSHDFDPDNPEIFKL